MTVNVLFIVTTYDDRIVIITKYKLINLIQTQIFQFEFLCCKNRLNTSIVKYKYIN